MGWSLPHFRASIAGLDKPKITEHVGLAYPTSFGLLENQEKNRGAVIYDPAKMIAVGAAQPNVTVLVRRQLPF
jgi:hypothetical protein